MDYALLAFASVLGFGDGPWYFVFIIAALLTLLASGKHRRFANNYAHFGAAKVFAVFVAVSVANNAFFAAAAFSLGRGVAWLIAV